MREGGGQKRPARGKSRRIPRLPQRQRDTGETVRRIDDDQLSRETRVEDRFPGKADLSRRLPHVEAEAAALPALLVLVAAGEEEVIRLLRQRAPVEQVLDEKTHVLQRREDTRVADGTSGKARQLVMDDAEGKQDTAAFCNRSRQRQQSPFDCIMPRMYPSANDIPVSHQSCASSRGV